MINSPCEQQLEEPVDHPKIISSVSTYTLRINNNITNLYVKLWLVMDLRMHACTII